MKKVLLSFALLGICGSAFSQIVWNDNFNSLTNGNLGTDITGVTPGQNGWLTVAPSTATNSANSNFEIYDADATHLKALKILGSNTISGTKSVTKGDVANAWTNRTSGNNIIQAEFDFFTGPASTSTNQTRFYVLNSTTSGTTTTNKFLIGFTYKHSTKAPGILFYMDPCVVLGSAYCTGTYPAGNYTLSYNNSSGTAITLNDNEWIKVKISYNYTDGKVGMKIVRADGSTLLDESPQGAAPTTNVTSAAMAVSAISVSSETSNSVAATGTFDNVKLSIGTAATLNTENIELKAIRGVKIYPNPATDFLEINADKIAKVEVFDISGKKINVKFDGNKVNVSNLSPGTYIINVNTKDGVVTEKFIKK